MASACFSLYDMDLMQLYNDRRKRWLMVLLVVYDIIFGCGFYLPEVQIQQRHANDQAGDQGRYKQRIIMRG